MLPASLLSNVVYTFSCHCDSLWVGCTFQRLQDGIRQHVPKFIRTVQIPNFRNTSTRSGKSLTPVMFSESLIDQHLLDNPMCAKNYSDENFTIFSFRRSFLHFICFRSRLHQIMQAKYMPSKTVCLELETLALITCCDAFFKHPIIFV